MFRHSLTNSAQYLLELESDWHNFYKVFCSLLFFFSNQRFVTPSPGSVIYQAGAVVATSEQYELFAFGKENAQREKYEKQTKIHLRRAPSESMGTVFLLK